MFPPIPFAGQMSGIAGLFRSATFHAPLRDLGNGEVSLVLARGSGSATFTRATTAYTTLSDGVTLKQVASGTPRSNYSASGVYLGYLSEGLRTNLLTWSSDWTNAAWAKVTMNTAFTSTGPDGVANSATRLTAAGALSTILQLYVAAAADRTWSVWMRRVTGTGTIKLFQGATKSADLASSLNASTYSQIQLDATVDVTLLGVGVEIGTSTDAVDVWVGQFEPGPFASSPIPTTTAAATRNADALTYPSAGNISGTVGTVYAEHSVMWSTAPGFVGVVETFGNSGPLRYESGNAATTISTNDGATSITKTGLLTALNTTVKRVSTWSAPTSRAITGDGAAVQASTFDGDFNITAIAIGCGTTGVDNLFGNIKNVRIFPRALSNSESQSVTTP